MRAILYIRVSTEHQAQSGLGLAAQLEKIRAYAAMQGWEVVAELTDAAVTTKLPMARRPGLAEGIAMIKAGDADVMVAASLSRFARTTRELELLFSMSSNPKTRFKMVAIDFGLDTSTATGRLMARQFAAILNWERDMASERTSDALQALKASGKQLGAAVQVSADTEALIVALHDEGRSSFQAIARELSRRGIHTPRGERVWGKSTVHAVYCRVQAAQAA